VDGSYSAKSAYEAQFFGMTIWKAEMEDKHKFFAWHLIQSKILTADKIQARNWPCNQTCVLCDQEDETAIHLCFNCSFAKQVRDLVKSSANNMIVMPIHMIQFIQDWWELELRGLPNKERRSNAAIIIYTVWNIWKE